MTANANGIKLGHHKGSTMTFPYKCPKCGCISAQADADSTECYNCKTYDSLTHYELRQIITLIEPNTVIADVGAMFGRLEFCLEAEAVQYRYMYCIDARTEHLERERVRYFQCNTFCIHDVEQVISQVSPVDLLILDAHDDYDGAKNDFYRFCGIVKVGGKIVLHNYNNTSFWRFIAELEQTRNLTVTADNLVIVDWR